MCLAIPMKVTEIYSPDSALVESGGISLEIATHLVENLEIGDYVIVHTGFALEKMDPEAAAETLDVFSELASMTNKVTDRAQK